MTLIQPDYLLYVVWPNDWEMTWLITRLRLSWSWMCWRCHIAWKGEAGWNDKFSKVIETWKFYIAHSVWRAENMCYAVSLIVGFSLTIYLWEWIHGYVCSKSQFMNVVKSSRGICFCRSRRMICMLLKLLFPEMNRAKYCYLLKLEDFCSDSGYRKGWELVVGVDLRTNEVE